MSPDAGFWMPKTGPVKAGSTFLCPSPTSFSHEPAFLFTIPLSPPREQCVCSSSPPPHHPSIPFSPSIHLFGALCDISAMPGREGEREGQAGHCLPPNPRNINSVFLEQERRALASNLSDLMMSDPLISECQIVSFNPLHRPS